MAWLSAYRSIAGAPVLTSDVTPPTVPPQPTLIYESTPNSSGASYLVGWPRSVDPIVPGAVTSGTQQYIVTVSGAPQPPISDTAPIAAPLLSVIGTNVGGSLMTGSDNGSVLSATSFTGDTGPSPTADEFIYTKSISRIPLPGQFLVVALHITAETLLGAFSKRGVRFNGSPANNAVYCDFLSFGPAQGLKGEQRTAIGAAATGGVQITFPGYPFWLRMWMDSTGLVTRDYSTNSVTGALGDGTWTVYDTLTPALGPAFLVGRYADPNTSGGTGGTTSVTFDKYLASGLAGLTIAGSGVAGSTTPITVAAQDVAGNLSAASPVLNVVVPNVSPGFVAPVTWMTAIGGTQAANFSSPTWRQLASKYNLVEFTQDQFTQGGMTGGQNMATSMADVKARAAAQGNPLCKTGIYTIYERNFNSFNSYPEFRTLANLWNWWLRTSFPSGSIVTSDAGGSQLTNNSSFSPVATSGIANGLNINTYFAAYTLACFVSGTPASVGEINFAVANPSMDFIVRDNQFSGVRSAGAWESTTTSFPNEFNTGPFNVATFLQQGHAQDINAMRAANPNLLYGGNCDQIVYPASGASAPPIDPSYANLWDFPFEEAVIGPVNSTYTFASFQEMINRMIRQEQLLRAGGIPVFNNHTGPAPLNSSTNILWPDSQANWTNTFTCGFGTQNGWSCNFWQAARFIICTGLLRGHAVCVESDSSNVWFYMDEFNKAGTQFNWLGTPTGSYQSAPTYAIGANGVWVMPYQFGTVVVNPVGNGPVTLPASFSGHRLPAGPLCDPAVNNGAAFGTTYGAAALTLQNGDGMIVLP